MSVYMICTRPTHGQIFNMFANKAAVPPYLYMLPCLFVRDITTLSTIFQSYRSGQFCIFTYKLLLLFIPS